MAKLLPGSKPDPAQDGPGCESLFVSGRCYRNTAAKFWAGLIDEVREDFPGCTGIELSAPSGERLTHKHLYPHIAFSESLQRLLHCDLAAVMQQSIAEMALFGPPAAVRVRILRDNREALAGELPSECLDEETFSCLLTWLLEWGELPASRWNEEALSGRVDAEDRQRERVYRIGFVLTNHHVSEGLYQRTLALCLDPPGDLKTWR